MDNKKQLIREYLVKQYGKIEAGAPLISLTPVTMSAYDIIFDIKNYDPNASDEDEMLSNVEDIMLSDVLNKIIGGITEEEKNDIINEVLNRLPVAEEVSV